MFPLASGAWQAPHLLNVSESFTGKPAASGLSAGVVTFTSGLEPVSCEIAGMEREARGEVAPEPMDTPKANAKLD